MTTTMTNTLASAFLAAALALATAAAAPPTHLAAQQHHPSPVPADDPRAQRAGALAELMLAGDRAAIDAYIAEHGDPDWAQSGEPAAQLDPLMALIDGKDLHVEGYLAGPERSVIVVLMDAARNWTLIQVAMTPAPPFRLTALRQAEFGRRGGG